MAMPNQTLSLLVLIAVIFFLVWRSKQFHIGDRVALKANLSQVGTITGIPAPNAYDVLFDNGTESTVPGEALVKI